MSDETPPTTALASAVKAGFDRHALREKIMSRAQPGPWNLNGHWPAGLFEREPDDPNGASARALQTRRLADQVTIFNDAERIVFLERVWNESRATLETLTPWRIRVAWRLVREMARLAGLVSEDERLEDMEEGQPDPWTQRAGGAMPDFANSKGFMRRAWPIVEALCGPDGVPLLPPGVPEEFIDMTGVVSTYEPWNPDHDPRLHDWLNVIETIAKYLQIEHGSLEDPELGQRGMFGLDDPELVRLAFPSRLQIFAWEDALVSEALEYLYKDGQTQATKTVMLRHGLRDREAQSVLRMAMSLARRQLETVGVEDHRALMVIQLQEQMRRFAADGDNRNELAAMKQLAIVLGINKTDPADLAQEFMEIVADRNRRRRPEGRVALELVKRIPALVNATTPADRDLGGVDTGIGPARPRAVPAAS